MIKVFGATNSSEYKAALDIKKLFLQEHPQLLGNQKNLVAIIAGAKCYGQPVEDLDLVLIASFEQPLAFQPAMSFTNPSNNSQTERPSSVYIQSICTIIELKDHAPNSVRFRDTTAEVKYGKHWHNVSEQSHKQIFALKNYLSHKGLPAPYITNLIWFRNLQNYDLPARPHNMIAGSITWNMLFSVIAQVNAPRLIHHQWTLQAQTNSLNDDAIEEIRTTLTEQITPTPLDRRRMEQINAKSAQIQTLQETVGKQLLILRGRGGAGKTIRLLQLAKTLYEEEGARVLVLTYNKALVSDLRRILTILGVVDDVAQRSIRVQTVHSFFYRMLSELEIIDIGQDDFLQAYDDLKEQTIAYLDADVILALDIKNLKGNNSPDFLWDYIFIDEAQDWPDDERKILFRFYPYTVFAIADGVDQLIRNTQPANWIRSVTSTEKDVKPLRTCLRMKASLTRFVSTLAGELGLPTDEWRANNQVTGGQVKIIEGHAIYRKAFFENLLDYNSSTGNEPIDMLFCVPPNLADTTNKSAPAHQFPQWGLKVWDGTNPEVRSNYPTDNQQLRLVQYDSCRGLEGWVVVNFEIDKLYDYKLNQLRQNNTDTTDSTVIELQAKRWLFIPLTRAMDTLVIHVSSSPSPLKVALKAAAAKHPDFVTWIDK